MVFDLNRSAEFDDDDDNDNDMATSSDLSKHVKGESFSPVKDEDGFGCDQNIALDIERKLEVGSVVDGIEQAYVLYCEYARQTGFSVRKGSQKYFDQTSEIRMKMFHCSCSGEPDNKRSVGRVAMYKKQVTRMNCKARIRLLRERGGQWKISIFYKPHNHELVDPDQAYLLRSSRTLSFQKKAMLETLHAAGISVGRVCKFMEKESGDRQNVGFIRSDAYAHIDGLRRQSRIENGDANSLLQFLLDMSNKGPFFYWKVQLDDDGRLMNFFFRDGRCAIDYQCFGDVLSVDSTYKTNKYNMVCVPFVGINHHHQNIMFGLAFLSDETTASFEWLFGEFLASMYGKEPHVIFSDQCQALMNAVDYIFQSSSHRLCQWHINQNASAHFGSLNGNRSFKDLWYRCMNGCDTEDEFEETWTEMIVTYDLLDNRWFKAMYNLRRRWSSVFTNTRFSGGLHATSRSEVTNRVLKDLGKRSNTLFEFVANYIDIQTDWRARERAEDALCRGMPGQFVEGNHLLTHVAKVLTRAMYKMFEYEATHSINIRIEVLPEDPTTDELIFQVNSCSAESRSRLVMFNQKSLEISCTCRLWETKGVLCRHIFKILYLHNVEYVPERYLLRRWRRDAKDRCVHPMSAMQSSSTPNHFSEILFVNNIMRVVYDMAYESKGNMSSMTRLHDCIYNLRAELLGDEKILNSGLKGKRVSKTSQKSHFRDPAMVKTR